MESEHLKSIRGELKCITILLWCPIQSRQKLPPPQFCKWFHYTNHEESQSTCTSTRSSSSLSKTFKYRVGLQLDLLTILISLADMVVVGCLLGQNLMMIAIPLSWWASTKWLTWITCIRELRPHPSLFTHRERRNILLVSMERPQFYLLTVDAFFSPSRNIIRAKIGLGMSFNNSRRSLLFGSL